MNNRYISEQNDITELRTIKNGCYEDQKRKIEHDFPQTEFPGRYPIRTLHNNIMIAYNHYSLEAEAELKTSVNTNLSKDIQYSY